MKFSVIGVYLCILLEFCAGLNNMVYYCMLVYVTARYWIFLMKIAVIAPYLCMLVGFAVFNIMVYYCMLSYATVCSCTRLIKISVFGVYWLGNALV